MTLSATGFSRFCLCSGLTDPTIASNGDLRVPRFTVRKANSKGCWLVAAPWAFATCDSYLGQQYFQEITFVRFTEGWTRWKPMDFPFLNYEYEDSSLMLRAKGCTKGHQDTWSYLLKVDSSEQVSQMPLPLESATNCWMSILLLVLRCIFSDSCFLVLVLTRSSGDLFLIEVRGPLHSVSSTIKPDSSQVSRGQYSCLSKHEKVLCKCHVQINLDLC